MDHEYYMKEALRLAELALAQDETPVGCVFVCEGQIIGKGINDTNRSMNGSRHAEFQGIAEILKIYPAKVFRETDLYVTVEPCIMCAACLRQCGIRAVYYGCSNDRFGGNGGVLTIHSDLAPSMATSTSQSDIDQSSPSIDNPYPSHGGLFREEAIMLLRRFYVQENEKAPEPRPKKTRVLKTEVLPLSPVDFQSSGSSTSGRDDVQ